MSPFGLWLEPCGCTAYVLALREETPVQLDVRLLM